MPKHKQKLSKDSEFTLGCRGLGFINQDVESVALVRDSDENVYYRNDSMKSIHEISCLISKDCLVVLTSSLEKKKNREKISWAE
jgi:hypothetical protein